jgi:thiamine monophosphate kinase
MGEKETLVRLWRQFGRPDAKAWRDDSVFHPLPGGLTLVYSLDRPELIFDTGNRRLDLELFGRWSAAMVANDVIACGLRPMGIAFDVGTSTLAEDDVPIWAAGVQQVCSRYGMTYEGGNIGVGPEVVGMCYGICPAEQLIRRSGARPGDLILVTAYLGTGWALRYWQEKRPGSKFPLDSFREYQHAPWVNLKAFEEVWTLNAVTCGMDLSDGLIEFGYEILDQSGLSATFTPPRSSSEAVRYVAEEFNIPEYAFSFEPGYDSPFAHAWCVKKALSGQVISILNNHGVLHQIVGRVDEGDAGPQLAIGDLRIKLPRYWDDVYRQRGSVARWEDEILHPLRETGTQ